MEQVQLAMSMDPIEVAFLAGGRRRVMAAAAVRAVEDGAFTMAETGFALADPSRAEDPFARVLVDVVAERGTQHDARRLLAHAQFCARFEARALERRLIAGGLVREPSVLRPLLGRCTPRGKALLATARRAFAPAQIAPLNPALALALYGPRALAGTPYALRRPPRGGPSGGDAGCGSGFIGCGGGCGAGCGGGGGCGSSGCGGSA